MRPTRDRPCGDEGPPEVSAVRGVEDIRYAAMLAGDLDVLSEVLADGLSYTHTTGDIDTKESYLRAVADAVVQYRHLERLDERFAVHDHCVLATGRQLGLSIFRGAPRLIDSAYLAVWIPIGPHGWSLAGWHATLHAPTR